MKLEFVNPIPSLINDYEAVVIRAIARGWITEKEWNTRFKNFRDDAGYSMIHYFEAKMSGKIGTFLTENPIMIENRDELEKRFGIKIMNMKELAEFNKNEN
jgi:hypothetical protein